MEVAIGVFFLIVIAPLALTAMALLANRLEQFADRYLHASSLLGSLLDDTSNKAWWTFREPPGSTPAARVERPDPNGLPVADYRADGADEDGAPVKPAGAS